MDNTLQPHSSPGPLLLFSYSTSLLLSVSSEAEEEGRETRMGGNDEIIQVGNSVTWGEWVAKNPCLEEEGDPELGDSLQASVG